jgi:hypothetical protein
MNQPKFKKAERKNVKIRFALCGPTGSGKTFSALAIAQGLGSNIGVIDTERMSSDRYADLFSFSSCQLETFSPESYMSAIKAAEGFDVLIIDSLSHAWEGAEGMLERVDAIAKRTNTKSSFNAWGEATPLQRRLVDSILAFPGHVIVTMRSKMEYIQEKNEHTGKTSIRKIGLQPVQRQGIEYEFDLVADIDQEHNLIISKSRAAHLADKIINKAGKEFGIELKKWASGSDQIAPETKPVERVMELKPETKAETPAPSPLPDPAVGQKNLSEDVSRATPEKTSADIVFQLKTIRNLAMQKGANSADQIREMVERHVGRPIASATDLSAKERIMVLEALA